MSNSTSSPYYGVWSSNNYDDWKNSLWKSDSWGKTMMGASGGTGSGGGGISGGQYFGRAAVNGLEMWNTSIMTDMAQSAAAFQAETAASAAIFKGAIQAADYRDAGDTAVRNIGIVQREGMDQTTLRYNALRGEISGQRVAAAGSGIDLSSRTVGKAEQTSRSAAAWDVDRISRTTKNRADSLNAQAEAAYKNSAFATINSEYEAKTAKIMGNYQSELAGISGRFSMMKSGMNMVTNLGKGIADIWSGGWVSNAESANGMLGGKQFGMVS